MMSKKGLEFILWVTITLVVVAVLAFGFVWQSIAGFVGESVATNTRLLAEQLESVVNVLQSSPSGTVHEYTLPKITGNITIRGTLLEVHLRAAKDSYYKTHVIGNIPIAVRPTDPAIPDAIKFDAQNRELFLARCGNEVILSQDKSMIPCAS